MLERLSQDPMFADAIGNPVATLKSANSDDAGGRLFGTIPPKVSPGITRTAKIRILNNHVIIHPIPEWYVYSILPADPCPLQNPK